MKKIPAVILFLLSLAIFPFHFALAADSPKAAVQAPTKTDEADNLKIQIVVLEKTHGLQREVDALRSQFEAHDKHVDRVINIAGIAATLFGIVFAFIGYLVRQDAKEAAKETVKIRDEAKKLLEGIEAYHGQAKEKAKDMDDLSKKMAKAGEKPSAEIVDGLKREFDKLSNDLATTLSKATSEKDKISKSLEKELSAAKEVAKFLETNQDKPLPASHYFNLGYEADEDGEYEKAIANYDKAILLKPDYAIAYSNKAEALICLSKYGTAETLLVGNAARFIENGDKGIALYLLRLALAAQGKDDGTAKADYEALLKNNPDLNFKGWDCKALDKKLAEIEKNKELLNQIEKMKAIHAEFKKLAV